MALPFHVRTFWIIDCDTSAGVSFLPSKTPSEHYQCHGGRYAEGLCDQVLTYGGLSRPDPGAASLPFRFLDLARHFHPAQAAHVLGHTPIERLGDALAMLRGFKFSLVSGIRHERNLGQN